MHSVGSMYNCGTSSYIAEPCIGTKDTACVDVCPVDCIHPAKGRTYDDGRPMMYAIGHLPGQDLSPSQSNSSLPLGRQASAGPSLCLGSCPFLQRHLLTESVGGEDQATLSDSVVMYSGRI